MKVVTLLLERGADVNKVDENGWTALMHAAEEGHVETVTLLLERGADVNAAVKMTRQPSCNAAEGERRREGSRLYVELERM